MDMESPALDVFVVAFSLVAGVGFFAMMSRFSSDPFLFECVPTLFLGE